MQAINYTDGYKTGHKDQYPKDTNLIYSNLTPRSDKHAKFSDGEGVVVFGIQYFVKEFVIDRFKKEFFDVPKEEAVKNLKRTMKNYLFKDYDTEHVEKLHDLGYLPITIKALPEGSLCPIGVPCLTIVNKGKDFFWLTNFLETLMSATLWQPMTNATIARHYKKLMLKYAKKTGSPIDFVDFQGHDFSFRGMPGLEAAMTSGAAHLTSFVGTDTIPAIDFLEKYYNTDADEELIACTVPATEHSVMCMGGQETEIETFDRLISEVYPEGIVSIVSDTWDFWQVVTEFLPKLKDKIMSRNGKVVIRPDSGNPVDIICGAYDLNNEILFDEQQAEEKGLIQCLWETFGGTVNDEGYKVLDEHIGAIYGDSITPEICEEILKKLEEKGFASCNIVFGIGSFTYQYNTRDTFGFAMKATYGEINSQGYNIHKDPKTDSGIKKSAKGLLCVGKDEDGKYELHQECHPFQEMVGALEEVYDDGVLVRETSLSEIRKRVMETI
jgi:nicotinamide phosphoribosyltransferase